jgi:predicted metal-binding membrane protein
VRSAALAGWSAVAAMLACVAAVDHTRVALMVSLAPMIALMEAVRLERRAEGPPRHDLLLVAGLFAARLAIPHVDDHGPIMLSWNFLRPLLGRSP